LGGFVLLATLVLANVAFGTSTTVAGSGVISGSGTSYTLAVTNSGSDPIRCMRWFAPSGTTVPSASGPGTTSAFGNGFGSQGLNLATGQSATFTFTTSQAISASSNGELHLSGDCVTDIAGALSGPAAAQPPPPSGPCNCISLNGRVLAQSIKITNPGENGGLHMEFDVAWFMNCTTGTGGCTGQLKLSRPPKLKTRLTPSSGRIVCQTDCGTNRSGVLHFTLVVSSSSFGNETRKGKSLTLNVKRTCQGAKIASQKFVFVFNKVALVDKAKSRLK
jgi:hypothetical protein